MRRTAKRSPAASPPADPATNHATAEPPIRALQIIEAPIDSLHPDPANARRHPEANLAAIKASLRSFGQVEPILVRASDRRVVAGHGRLEAMRALGWRTVKIVELDLTDLEATRLNLALNRTAELAEWDDAALGKILATLRHEDGGLDGVGFEASEIDTLLDALRENDPLAALDDPGPEVPTSAAATRPGDLWLLGDHRLLCGDSTKPADVERLLQGDRPVLFSTDPPYCVQYTGNNRPIHDGKRSGKDWSQVYREVDIKDLGEFLDAVFQAYLPRIEERSPIYVWHAHTQQPTIAAVFEKHDLLLHQILVWKKPTPVFTHCYFQWQHEPCAFGWRRGHKPQHGIAQYSTVIEADWEGKARVVGNEHPTQKPLLLFERPIELHTRRGDVVVEPFSGSGSQLIAAERMGRKCRAMEITPAFVDVAIRRWQTASGKVATLAIDGRSYGEIAAERGVA